MRDDMDNTSEHRARLTVVENQVAEVRETVRDLSSTINKWIKEQSQVPRPIPFKEIITTAAATLAVFAGVMQFLDSRNERSLEVYKYRIEKLEGKVSPNVMLVRPVP